MPQIANQDYNVVVPQYAENIYYDAAALGLLAGHLERGTIFDVLVKIAKEDDRLSRVVATSKDYGNIVIVDPEDSSLNICPSPYSSTQYEGIAAVQVAVELDGEIPSFGRDESDYLMEASTGTYLCVDGKLVSAEVDADYKLAAVTISDEMPADDASWVNIPFKELQKLIGVEVG